MEGSCEAAACELAAIGRSIIVGLFGADLAPIDVQFLSDHHRQRGLDALADLGVFGDDRHHPVRGNGHIGIQCPSLGALGISCPR